MSSRNGEHSPFGPKKVNAKIKPVDVLFQVNQGHSPQLLLRLERGKCKPMKKKSHFSSIVSNVFGIGSKRESANLVAYSELPLNLFNLVSDHQDYTEMDPVEVRRLYRDIKIPTKLLIRQPEAGKKSKKKKNKSGQPQVLSAGVVNGASPDSPSCAPEMMAEVRLNLTKIKVTKAKREVTFNIQGGAFYDCVMPEQLESLWGPIPLPKLPSVQLNTCKAVTHG